MADSNVLSILSGSRITFQQTYCSMFTKILKKVRKSGKCNKKRQKLTI